MAKKPIIENYNPKLSDFDRFNDDAPEIEEFNKMRLMLMMALAEMGVTPEEYSAFLADSETRTELKKQIMSNDLDTFGVGRSEPEEVHAIPDADKKSLRLKIQMKDVTKPPMWREVVIPADFDFIHLHQVIQIVTGLENCHLWQFQRKAYDHGLQIGIPPEGPEGMGLDDYTHDAGLTPVTGFLAKKGDKLEYVYDFGDDWIFTVSVLEVMDRVGEVAECMKWKCDFQPLEDCGGVGTYLMLRDVFSAPDKLSAKMKKEFAGEFGYDDFRELEAWVDDAKMDIEYVNEQLADLTQD